MQHLRRLAGGAAEPGNDADLLTRFITDRDQAAFEDLVRKHGPLVWSVCRRLLDQDDDAEDVFQATFLVLVRRAGSIRKRAALASWLYGVACRLAHRFQAEQALRRSHEQRTLPLSVTDPAQEAAGRESARLVVDEVHRLPEKYRRPVVLCYLAGRTHEQAALECSCRVSTLKTRLRRALQLLAKRLSRRGLVLPAGTVASLLAEGKVSALVPARLLSLSVVAALAFASGTAVVPGSATAVRLAEELLRISLLAWPRPVAVLLLAGTLLAGGGILARAWRIEPPEEQGNTAGPPQPQPVAMLPFNERLRPGPGAFLHEGPPEASVFSPDWRWVLSGSVAEPLHLWKTETGEEVCRFTGHEARVRRGDFFITLSPDGKLAAAPGHSVDGFRMHVWETTTGKRVAHLGAGLASGYPNPLFLPTGELLVYAETSPDINLDQRSAADLPTVGHKVERRFYLWNPADRRAREILPGVSGRYVASADGRFLASLPPPRRRSHTTDPRTGFPPGEDLTPRPEEVRIWDLKTGRVLTNLTYYEPLYDHAMVFSPDGSALLHYGRDNFAHIRDVRSGKERPAPGIRGWPCALSPDGKKLADNLGGEAVEVWDLERGRRLHRLRTGGAKDGRKGLTFSPDGTVLATWGGDSRIHFWDVATGRER
jgi:RNA polymerase sigma factor (sigma-70 family)